MPTDTTTQPKLDDADQKRATEIAQLEAQRAALAKQETALEHVQYIVREGGVPTTFFATSDAAAVEQVAGPGHEGRHRHGRGDQRGACRPVWRVDKSAAGVATQHAVNPCAKGFGGDGAIVPAALL